MPRLSELLGDRSEVVVSFPGADVHITYRPSVYTRQFEAELAQLDPSTPDEEARDKCDAMLSALIADWDLTDEDDEPIAPKRGEISAKVPVMFLVLFVNKLVQAIAGEAVAGRRTMTTTQPTPLPTNRVERRAAAHKR